MNPSLSIQDDNEANNGCFRSKNNYFNFFATTTISPTKIMTFIKELVWKIRLHGRFTLAPIIKTTPNLLFKVFAYTLILTYSSDWYSGIGLLFPFGLFAIITLLSFVKN